MPNLPNIAFADVDARRVEASIITSFEAAARLAGQTDFTLYDGDPRRLFLAAVAMLIVQQNALIDLTGKSNLLRFADDSTIEDIGWLYGPRGDRLQPTRAMTTIEFTLSAIRTTTTTIKAGTRLVVGELTFGTAIVLDIPAGETTGTVLAYCQEVGALGNSLVPGQVFQIMDPTPFVESAINITESAGGSDLEGLEAYRDRIRNTPESFSTAGPDGAYWFWARTANAGIIDVDVWMPDLDMEVWKQFIKSIYASVGVPTIVDDELGKYWHDQFMNLCRTTGTGPGNVNVSPLMEGGQIPTQDILDAVYETCNDRRVRPLTDFLHVIPPTAINFDINFTYWIDGADVTRTTEIQNAVNAAVQDYITWQSGALGRSLIPDRLTQLVKEAGARRLEIKSPIYTPLSRGQVAQLENTTVSYGGIERDNRRGLPNA
jgi:phage-related baseplate assembly protein